MVWRSTTSVFLLAAMMICGSCVEPVTPDLNEADSESLLVVDAKITDEEGPFRVKLTTSVPVNVMYYPEPVLNAEVRILDDQGHVYQLYGNDRGIYETPEKDLAGIPGYTYTLHITTRDGLQYESTPEMMLKTPEIDSLYSEEVIKTTFADGQARDDTWMNILVDSKDLQGNTRFWYFKFEETWEVRMNTDNVKVNHTPPGEGPMNITWDNILVDDEKVTCWVNMPSASILVASTANNPVNELKRHMIQTLGPDEDKLHISYTILARQSAISREQFDYWKRLMDANENVGGIYGKIPSRVTGNITCINAADLVLGNFSAFSVREKRLFIQKQDHHVRTVSAYKECSYFTYGLRIPVSFFGITDGTGIPVYCISDFCADCRKYGTNVKPDYWK